MYSQGEGTGDGDSAWRVKEEGRNKKEEIKQKIHKSRSRIGRGEAENTSKGVDFNREFWCHGNNILEMKTRNVKYFLCFGNPRWQYAVRSSQIIGNKQQTMTKRRTYFFSDIDRTLLVPKLFNWNYNSLFDIFPFILVSVLLFLTWFYFCQSLKLLPSLHAYSNYVFGIHFEKKNSVFCYEDNSNNKHCYFVCFPWQ